MIRAIIFDFDNTLCDYVASDMAAVRRMIELLPGRVDEERFLETSVEAVMEAQRLGPWQVANYHRFRFEKTLAAFGLPWNEVAYEAYYEQFVVRSFLFDGVSSVLAGLQGRVKLGILSNSPYAEEQKRRVASTGIAPFFSLIATSGDIGRQKPAPETFHFMLKEMGCRAEETIFVGDSETHDIVGAKGVGMVALKKLDAGAKPGKSIADGFFHGFGELSRILSERFQVG